MASSGGFFGGVEVVRNPRIDSQWIAPWLLAELLFALWAAPVVAQPDNDLFVHRAPLVGTNLTVQGYNLDATAELDEPRHAGPDIEPRSTVWWSWTAPSDGYMRVNLLTTYGFPLGVSIYSGSVLNQLAPLRDLAANGGFVPVRSGVSYAIAAYTWEQFGSLGEGAFSFQLEFTGLPQNDLFARSAPLLGYTNTVRGWNLGATREAGEPMHGLLAGEGSLWWTWTAPADGLATVWPGPSAFAPMLAVYGGASLESLTQIATNAPGAELVFAAQAGRSYRMALASESADAGLFSFGIALSSLRITSPSDGTTFFQPDSVRLELEGEPYQLPITGLEVRDQSGLVQAMIGGPYVPREIVVPSLSLGRHDIYLVAQVQPSLLAFRTLPLTLWLTFPNDAFAGRLPLSGKDTVVRGDLRGASVEPGEPPPPNSFHPETVWWTWTAPASGKVSLTADANIGAVELFTGNQVSALTKIGPVPGNDSQFDVTAGTTYQIRVATLQLPWLFDLHLHLIDPPPNDNFVAREMLTGTSVSRTINPHDATVEPGESANYNTVWYSWTAPARGRLQVFPGDPYGTAAVVVFTGNTLSNLTLVSAGFWVDMPTESGRTYQIQIQVGTGQATTLAFSLAFQPASGNDNFAQRISIVGDSGKLTGNNFFATIEAGEPQLFGNRGQRSLWWTWTAPFNGVWEIVPENSGIDPVLALFTGNSVSGLTEVGRADLDFFPYSLLLRVAAGQTYQLQLDGVPTSTGDFTLSYFFHPRPANDLFANRIVLTGASTNFDASTWNATRETDDPLAPAGSPNDRLHNTVWWTWTAPASGWARFSARGFRDRPYLEVFEGETLTALNPVSRFSGNSVGVAAFEAVAGRTYQLLLAYSAFRNSPPPPGGEFQLSLDLTTLRILSPASNSVITLPASPQFVVNAPDPAIDGQIVRVEYRIGNPDDPQGTSYSAGATTNPPFSLTPTNVEPATATVFAVATTDSGRTRTSAAVTYRWRPGNDDFAMRQVLTDHVIYANGTVGGAGSEAGEPSPFTTAPFASVWYSWTAPASGPVSLWQSGVNHLAVFQGDTLAALQRLADLTQAEAGQTYQIQVSDSPSYGHFSLHLTLQSVSVVEPQWGATFREGDPILCRIQTSDDPGSILAVDYLNHNDVVTSVSVAPYSALWTNAPAGYLELSARLRLRSGEEVSSRQFPVSVYVLPRNDDFAYRTRLSGTNALMTGTTVPSSLNPGEPAGAIGVWFEWTAPADGVVSFVPATGTPAPAVNLFMGIELAQLQAVPGESKLTQALGGPSFRVTGGQTYQMAVNALSGWLLECRLLFRAQPANDLFAGREVITGLTRRTDASMKVATAEPGEPAHPSMFFFDPNPMPRRSLWWTWTAPSAGLVTLTPPVDPGSLKLGVYTGATLGALSPVTRIGATGMFQPFQFIAQGGLAYQIAFDDGDPVGRVGDFSWQFDFAPGAANDAFAGRLALSGRRLVIDIFSVGATREAGEPAHGGRLDGGSLWWTWTAPAAGRAYLNLEHPAAFQPVIAVYTGSTLATLNPLASGVTSCSFDVGAGTVCQIAIDDASPPPAQWTFLLRLDYPPPNDLFAARQAISGERATVPGWNRLSHREFQEPLHAGQFGGRSVWYSWRSPYLGSATLRLSGELQSSLLAVYEGNALDALRAVAAQSATGVNALLFNTQAGHDYQIAVDGAGGSAGDFDLELISAPGALELALEVASVSDSVIRLRATGASTGTIELQASPDLLQWQTVASGMAGSNPLELEERPDPMPFSRFYRVVLRP